MVAMAVTIRPAELEDLPSIVEIYNEAGVATTASYDLEPVTVEERTEWFERLRSRNHPVLVLVKDGEIVGYANYGPFRDKDAYRHTVEHSLYVAAPHRASGAGRMLMGALLDHARGHGVHTMVGVLDAENAASRAFHARMGFEEVGVLREVGFKFGRWLDVVFVTQHLE